MTTRTALIVGAGIGGLAAGIALERAGWRVSIFERAAHPRALGFALNLAPNAVEALRELGLAECVIAAGRVVSGVELRDGSGRLLKRFSVATKSLRTTSVFALRSALHGALLEATVPGTLALDSEAVRFETGREGVVLTMKDGHSERGDVLIGADGFGSVIRKQLHPAEPPPRRSGYFGIRGVAFNAAVHLGDLSAVGYLGTGIEAATARASADAVYWYVSLLAEDVSTMALVPEDMLRYCAMLLDDGFRAVVHATRPEDLRIDELFDRNPLAHWGTGPVSLLGDAAHPMLPHTGQGAAQALEDAGALGIALAPVGNPVEALRRYEKVRSRRTARIVRRGRHIAKFTTTRNPVLGWVRAASIRIMPARAAAAGFLRARRIDPHRALR